MEKLDPSMGKVALRIQEDNAAMHPKIEDRHVDLVYDLTMPYGWMVPGDNGWQPASQTSLRDGSITDPNECTYDWANIAHVLGINQGDTGALDNAMELRVTNYINNTCLHEASHGVGCSDDFGTILNHPQNPPCVMYFMDMQDDNYNNANLAYGPALHLAEHQQEVQHYVNAHAH